MPCLACGCPTRGKPYCPAHQAQQHVRDKPSPTKRGYDRAWNKLRAQILRDMGTQCHYCGDHADTVDHVVPISVDPTLRLEPTNLVPACRSCNSARAAHHPQ